MFVSMCLSILMFVAHHINTGKQTATRGHNRSFYAHWSRSFEVCVGWRGQGDLKVFRYTSAAIFIRCEWLIHDKKQDVEWERDCVPAECDSKVDLLNDMIKTTTNDVQNIHYLPQFSVRKSSNSNISLKFVERASQKFTLSFNLSFCVRTCCLALLQCSSTVNISRVYGIFCTAADGRAAEYSHRSLYQIFCNVRKQRGTASYPAITSNLAAVRINYTSRATS